MLVITKKEENGSRIGVDGKYSMTVFEGFFFSYSQMNGLKEGTFRSRSETKVKTASRLPVMNLKHPFSYN